MSSPKVTTASGYMIHPRRRSSPDSRHRLADWGSTPHIWTASADGFYIFVVTAGDGVNPGALDIIATGNYGVLPSVPLGVKPKFAFVDPFLDRLYVTNSGSNTVSVFDASNVNVTGSPAIPRLATANVGTTPVSVTALPNGTRFYVANSGSERCNGCQCHQFCRA